MFNLLPENLKSFIHSEYRMRRLVLALLFIILIEISLLIFLFPTWLESNAKEKAITKQSEQASESLKNSDINPATVIIKSINTKLSVLNVALNYPKVTPFVNQILEKKSSTISINQITYNLVSSSTANITVGGVSKTREALVSFVKKLQETNSFKKVDLPISNLAKDKNIEFTLNLSIQQ
jgi:hypothetical protein